MFFFKRITARPSECLVVVRNGKMQNLGNGASTVVHPWDSFVFVPTSTIEHCFQMHQESIDGITLRFKGVVIYRIIDVEHVASLFDFSGGGDPISHAIGDICLGELRAIVAAMSMEQCINERKTTLTEHLKEAVLPIAEGRGESKGWGIRIDVLQVAQVFCPDEKLLAQLQAEARDKIRKVAQFSQIETNRELESARIDSEIQLSAQTVQLDKEKLEKTREIEEKRLGSEGAVRLSELEKQREIETKRIASEGAVKLSALESNKVYEEKKIANESILAITELENRKLSEEKRIAIESQLRLLEIEKQKEIAKQELELKALQSKVQAIEVSDEANKAKTLMEIKKEILPLELLPKISENLTGIFKDARLTITGNENPVQSSLMTSLDLIFDRVREIYDVKKPDVKVEAKPAGKPEGALDANAGVKPVVKAEEKPSVKPDMKVEEKAAPKPDDKKL